MTQKQNEKYQSEYKACCMLLGTLNEKQMSAILEILKSLQQPVSLSPEECEKEAITFSKSKLRIVGGLLSDEYKLGFKEGVEHYITSKISKQP